MKKTGEEQLNQNNKIDVTTDLYLKNKEIDSNIIIPLNLINFLEALPMPVVVKTPDHVIVFENSAAITLFGDKLGRPCFARFVPDSNECDCPLRTSEEFTLDIQEIHNVKHEIMLEEDIIRYVAIVNIPMFLNDNTPAFYIELVKDLTNDFLVDLLSELPLSFARGFLLHRGDSLHRRYGPSQPCKKNTYKKNI